MPEFTDSHAEKLIEVSSRMDRAELRLTRLEENESRLREERRNFYKTFENLSLENQKQESTIHALEKKLDIIERKLDEFSKKLDEIKAGPANNANKFKSAIISSIGSAIGTGLILLIAMALLTAGI